MYSKVYIILLNYNGWWDTIECLESVLRNDYPNYQVIVIDNNSPNNSMEHIKAWADGKLDVWIKPDNLLRHLSFPPLPKPAPYVFYTREEAENGGMKALEEKFSENDFKGLTTKYPLIFIQSGNNLGFASGNNVGIRYSLTKDDFEAIILLNNDTVIKKDTLRILMDAYENKRDSGIYGGRIYYYSKPKMIWYDGGTFNKLLGITTHTNKKRSNIPCKYEIKEVNFITFCYILIPKKILKNVGLLDESYFMYVEDLDYSYRVMKNGYKLYHICNSSIYHKVGASSGEEVSPFSAYWIMRNRVRFIKIHLDFFSKISAFLFIVYLILRKFIIYILIGKWGKIIKIKAQIYGILSGIMHCDNVKNYKKLKLKR